MLKLYRYICNTYLLTYCCCISRKYTYFTVTVLLFFTVTSCNGWSGSGSCYFRHWPLKDASKKLIFYTSFSAYYFLKLHLHHISKIKSQSKKSQNSRNQGFSYYFCMMIEGSGVGSGSIPLTNGSGSGTPKNMWIRIRIRVRNTG